MSKCDFTLSLHLTVFQMRETAKTEVKQCEILDNITKNDS